ncbi:MAG: YbaN family protein [Spirochaetia bacterium]|nr:YbaN family protein [Spirochaetia bacterium]
MGVLGIFLPVLPTTPLVMLSAFLLGKSSSRFNQWITSTWVYEKYAKDFVEHRSMSLGRKIFLLSLASVMLLFPLIILAPLWKLVIVGVYIFLYYYFIYKIKTITSQDSMK